MEREFKVGEAIICPKCGILMTPANQIPPDKLKCSCGQVMQVNFKVRFWKASRLIVTWE